MSFNIFKDFGARDPFFKKILMEVTERKYNGFILHKSFFCFVAYNYIFHISFERANYIGVTLGALWMK